MKRWSLGACALAAAALVAGTAGAAQAQYPGSNGARLIDSGIDSPDWRPMCMQPPAGVSPDYLLDYGGAAFSPDGKHLAAVVYDGYPTAPATSTPDGPALEVAGVAPCTPEHIANVDAGTTLSYSPDGTQLAVTQGGDIHVINAGTGADARNLTPNLASTREFDPTWSPKGTGIAYQASDGLRVRPATGGASTLLVKGTAQRADWSPDGTKIAYIDATSHISYLTLSTHVVTRTPIDASSFTWSPDGHYFLFGVADVDNTCATATTYGKIVSRQSTDACIALAWQPLH